MNAVEQTVYGESDWLLVVAFRELKGRFSCLKRGEALEALLLLGVWGIKAWMSSLYADLGLSDRSASPSTVRRAWQKLALELHPDRNIGGSKDDTG